MLSPGEFITFVRLYSNNSLIAGLVFSVLLGFNNEDLSTEGDVHPQSRLGPVWIRLVRLDSSSKLMNIKFVPPNATPTDYVESTSTTTTTTVNSIDTPLTEANNNICVTGSATRRLWDQS